MQILGLTITRQKQVPQVLSSVDGNRGWFGVIREAFAGAWQRNMEYTADDVLSQSTIWSCITLIASDISKSRLKLMSVDRDGISEEIENVAYSPVLRRPNHYQNRIKFLEYWMISKLTRGNAYALKYRDDSQKVRRVYPLDPSRVRVAVAPDGEVFYQIQADALSGVVEGLTIPASEIMHDLMVPLFHPLVGVSPIFACGLAAMQGLKIQRNSEKFFANNSQPGGVLTAPGSISTETAQRAKDFWEANFSGENVGRVAVLGDGLKYEPMAVTAVDAQLVEQLKWSGETICSCFHIPPYMVGIGPPPNYNNIEALNQQYYSQCLQQLIESLEIVWTEGLEMLSGYEVELDIDALLRMDTNTKTKTAAEQVQSGAVAPNEVRKRYFNLKPVKGGDTPFMQQQNWPIEALAARDQQQLTPAAPPPRQLPEQQARQTPIVSRAELTQAVDRLIRKEFGLQAA